MEEHEDCDYDHTLIDDPSAQGGMVMGKIALLGEDNINMCKDVVIARDGITC
jgi:hypothetical protein